MISSQQARPPPRSLAHHHQPLRGVITTRGAALLVCSWNHRDDVERLDLHAFNMCCQQGLRALSRAIGKEWRFLAGNLQHRRTKRTQKTVGIAWAKSGARARG